MLTLQAERVRDAAWGCDWVGTPLTFMRCLGFIIKMANKEFELTAGKCVPVSKATMMNVRYYFVIYRMKCMEHFIKEFDETNNYNGIRKLYLHIIILS
jgi:hypothetical protein